jgi:radical SAM protein with 4Fe4S-binding SPASM domain
VIVEKSYRLDDGIRLPDDTRLLFPQAPPQQAFVTGVAKAGCSDCQSGGCATNKTKLAEQMLGKFLAVAPSVASYIVLDKDFLPAFESIRQGKRLRETRTILARDFGEQEAAAKLQHILHHITARHFYHGAKTEEYLPTSPNMQMYVTNRCNLRCEHCYMSSGEALPQGEIGTVERLRAIRLFAKSCPGSKITFTGGEALVSPDIFDLIDCARSEGLRVELYSNGLTIKNSVFAERIVKVVDELQISIDGATAAVNDAIRGRGTFNGIVRGIKLIDAARVKLQARSFKLRLAMTLTAANAEDIQTKLPSLIESLCLSGMPEVRIGAVNKLGRASSRPEMFSNSDDIRLMQAVIVNEFAQRGIYKLPISTTNRFSRTCGMGLSITVGADGAIYPCTITEQRPIGNVRDDNAGDVIKSVFPYMARTNVDQVAGCRDCSIRYSCGGMCRISNFFARGDMNVSACTPEYKALMVRDLISKYESYGLPS